MSTIVTNTTNTKVNLTFENYLNYYCISINNSYLSYMENLGFKGTWGNNNLKIKVTIDVISFEDEGSTIFYCPAFDLSGYGNDDKEAKQSFQIVLDQYFTYTLNKGTFNKELKRLGWKVTKSKRKPITPPNLESLLRDNENFNTIFNNHDFKKFTEGIDIPQPVAMA